MLIRRFLFGNDIDYYLFDEAFSIIAEDIINGDSSLVVIDIRHSNQSESLTKLKQEFKQHKELTKEQFQSIKSHLKIKS